MADKHKADGGEFVVDPYKTNDTDKDKNSRKKVGANFDITFTPAESVRSKKISFVQIMKNTKSDVPYLFKNEKPRATTKKDGDAGWAIDRLDQKKSPNYGEENDGKAGGNTKFGSRKSKTEHKDAWMHDSLSLIRAKDQKVEGEATTFALDNDSSKYLGAIRWGYKCDTAGKVTLDKVTVHSKGNPGGVQKAALKKWNDQATGPEADRNHKDQEKVPVP